MVSLDPKIIQDAGDLGISDFHLALLSLTARETVTKNHAVLGLLVWLTQFPDSRYPGTLWMADLLGMTRFVVRRAEKQLEANGLVRWTNDRSKRYFKITATKEALQTQVVAYCKIFSIALGPAVPKTRLVKMKGETEVPATKIKFSPEPITDPNTPTKIDPGTTEPLQKIPKTRSKITPEEFSLICSSGTSMLRYLLYGKEAASDLAGQYPPTRLNWEQFRKSPEDPGVLEWGTQQFVGYYWYQVSAYRVGHQMALTLPVWEKLGAHIANLLQRCTKPQLHHLVTFVVYYFDVIRWMLRRAGNTVFLNEDTLVNPLVQNCANNLIAMSEAERQNLINEYKTELGLS